MNFDEFISALAGIAAPLEKAFEALREYRKISADDFFVEGYTPMEYARRNCKEAIIREVFRPCECRYLIFSCLCSVPGMIRKRGRWVKRGGGYNVGYNRRVSE